MQPFMARLRWLRARRLGCPLFREDGGAGRRVLKVSNTFENTYARRRMGTIKGIVAGFLACRVRKHLSEGHSNPGFREA